MNQIVSYLLMGAAGMAIGFVAPISRPLLFALGMSAVLMAYLAGKIA